MLRPYLDPDPLERLIWQDTLAEILDLMTPYELIIAVLRLEGLTDAEIGEMLGTHRGAVAQHMLDLQEWIVRRKPELASFLSSRQRPSGISRTSAPLERGWLCDWTGQCPEDED